jgi:hypothetical protein
MLDNTDRNITFVAFLFDIHLLFRTQAMIRHFLRAIWICALAIGCQPAADGPAENPEADRLLEQTRSWHCRLEEINQQSKLMWDSVAQAMDAQLPADMPADERHNMLAVRNTSLIQMFMVYPQLDAAVRQLVETAGTRDVELGMMLRAAQDSLERCDSLSQSMLIDMAKTDPKALAHWKSAFANVRCEGGTPVKK